MFKPRDAGSCSFNVSVITLSIVLFVAFTLVSISPLVANGSLFPSAVMSVYTMYLAYSALQSEPHSEQCNGLGHKIDAASGTTLAVGMLVTLLSVVYSAAKCVIPITLTLTAAGFLLIVKHKACCREHQSSAMVQCPWLAAQVSAILQHSAYPLFCS